MKKIFYLLIFSLTFLIGVKGVEADNNIVCDWYVREYENNTSQENFSNNLYNFISWENDAKIRYTISNSGKLSVQIMGLKDGYSATEGYSTNSMVKILIQKNNSISSNQDYNIYTLTFDKNNIVSDDGNATCPFPTIYYKMSQQNGTNSVDFIFETEKSFSQGTIPTSFGYLTNIKVNTTEHSCSSHIDINSCNADKNCSWYGGTTNQCFPKKEEIFTEENWCNVYYYVNNTNYSNQEYSDRFVINFWKNNDGILMYNIKKYGINVNEKNYKTIKPSLDDDWNTAGQKIIYETNKEIAQANKRYEFVSKDLVTETNNGLICSGPIITDTDTDGYDEIQKVIEQNGTKFLLRLQSLQMYFEALAKEKQININGKLNLKIDGNDKKFGWIDGLPSLDTYQSDNLEYLTMQKINDVSEYCNNYYSNADIYKKQSTFENRMDECVSFINMINEASNLGLIDNSTLDCDIFSDDFTNILIKILDIVKIAGPILALGLGTIDFIKAMTSGDADKKMKAAFKRLSTRLIAAVLLFIIPFILAFLMDTFLGNVDGYDSDNPFCGLVEWGEK